MTSSSSNNSPKKNSGWGNILIWTLLALLLRWQVVEPRWIPSGSMLPTLELKDRVLVEKIRPRVKNLFHKHLNRDSLIVFKAPQNLIESGYESKSALIKRIVGIPGDQIEVSNGKLFRNENEIEEPWLEEPIQYEMRKIVVPEGYLWVLGDNRNNSLDSHIWGFLPEQNVIGTAIWRYWPLRRLGAIRFPTHPNNEVGNLNAIRSGL